MNAAAAPYDSHQQHAYMEPHPHLPSSHGHTPVSAAQYSHYQQQAQHMVQPHYAPATGYYYQQPTPSPQSASHASSHYTGQTQASLPPSMTPATPAPPMDPRGQTAPPGSKPKVTATLWEDEGTLCFQIESKGICVARREDNHMINGTKLLNVAGMTRGRRDGILKSEKVRNVVKIGPMHLKGVWIPFERALEFANKEKITDQLYPLFVHNIGALLHHPQNRDAARRREENQQAGQQQPSTSQYKTPSTSQAPPLLHAHSMAPTVGSHSSQTSQPLAPHPIAGRPGLDRAHTFPTPPTSASSALGGIHGSHEWTGYGTSIPVSQPLALDTSGLGNTRSMPTTPASTPPGGSLQSLPSYQNTHGYDNSRYSATSHGQYSQYQPSIPSQGDYGQSHSSYSTDRGNYTYNPNTSLQPEHMTPEAKASPSQHPGSGRATPRAMITPASQWHGGYGTPQRAQTIPSSNLTYNVTSESRGSATQSNGYPAPAGLVSSTPSQQYQYANGTAPSNKRMREVEDDDQDHYQRASSQGSDSGLKRRKAVRENSVGGGTSINRSVMTQAS